MFQAVARETGAFDETDLELTELLVKHARETLTRLERASATCGRTPPNSNGRTSDWRSSPASSPTTSAVR